MSEAAVVVRRAETGDLPQVSRLAGQLVRLHHATDPARFLLVDEVEAGYAWWLARELAQARGRGARRHRRAGRGRLRLAERSKAARLEPPARRPRRGARRLRRRGRAPRRRGRKARRGDRGRARTDGRPEDPALDDGRQRGRATSLPAPRVPRHDARDDARRGAASDALTFARPDVRTRSHARRTIQRSLRSRYCCSATALLCASSFAAKSRTTSPRAAASRSGFHASGCSSSSVRYRLTNSAHLVGSWANQRRKSSLGAAS